MTLREWLGWMFTYVALRIESYSHVESKKIAYRHVYEARKTNGGLGTRDGK